MKIRSSRRHAAFTLIELLVVITIIGILAGIALPAMQNAQTSARQTAVLSNCKQIVTALRLYAQDNDGKFPNYTTTADGTPTATVVTDSNQAFRQLFPAYMTNEKIFYCPNSAWTPTTPDNAYNTVGFSGADKSLAAGENHFAFFPGMNDSSNANWPLVCDGFAAAGADPEYAGNKSVKGGVWGGKIAIVAHPDASAEKIKLGADFKAIRTKTDGTKDKYFKADAADQEWFSQSAVNPLAAAGAGAP